MGEVESTVGRLGDEIFVVSVVAGVEMAEQFEG